MSDVSPPATGEWYDVDATVESCLAQLRLQGGDIDEPRLRAIVPGAAYKVDVKIDAVMVLDGPPPDPEIQHALEQLTLLRYRQLVPGVIMGTFPVVDDEDHLLDTLLVGRKVRYGVA